MRRTLPTILFLLTLLSCTGFAAEPFSTYPPEVKIQALRLINMARPGNEEVLEREVQSLRKAMLDYSILSINEVPERIFEQARNEGWEGNAIDVLRPATRIAPFSAALWMQLIKEDFRTFSIGRLINDIEGFHKTLGFYGLALAGCLTWIFLCAIAAVSWFAIWISISLFLRVQPAATADFARVFKLFPYPELFAFAAFIACLLAPVLAGAGLGAAAVIWLFLSAGYLRRRETMAAILSLFLLASVYICAGPLQLIVKYEEQTREEGWFAGEGFLPPRRQQAETSDTVSARLDPRLESIMLFARARAGMQVGDNEAAERLWDEWIRNAPDPSPGRNNRGIVRYRLGRIDEALADFEKAMETGPSMGPAFWNSYQIYLGIFRLEDAANVQEAAWRSLRKLSLFDFRAEEMTRGELLPSPLVTSGVWKEMFIPRLEWLLRNDESSVLRFLFRPLPNRLVAPLIAFLFIWMLLSRALTSGIRLHDVCRSCGVRSIAAGDVGPADICRQCDAQAGRGDKSGEDREIQRCLMDMHRRYVKACSVVAPGAGALWAGKTVSFLVYGIMFSLLLGVLTVSAGAENASSPLTSAVAKGVASGALMALALLWLLGVAWSFRSFDSLRRRYNIGPRR